MDIYQDLKTIQDIPPRLLKEFNTQVFILANKLMTDGSFVQNTSEPFGSLIAFQSAVTIVILKGAKRDSTGIDARLSTIAASPMDSREAVANMLLEADIFLALKQIATGSPEGAHDRAFFEKVISHGEMRLANGTQTVNTY